MFICLAFTPNTRTPFSGHQPKPALFIQGSKLTPARRSETEWNRLRQVVFILHLPDAG